MSQWWYARLSYEQNSESPYLEENVVSKSHSLLTLSYRVFSVDDKNFIFQPYSVSRIHTQELSHVWKLISLAYSLTSCLLRHLPFFDLPFHFSVKLSFACCFLFRLGKLPICTKMINKTIKGSKNMSKFRSQIKGKKEDLGYFPGLKVSKSSMMLLCLSSFVRSIC